MATIIWAAFLAIVGLKIFLIFRGLWKLQQLKIPDLKKFPIAIEVFYPIVKLAILSAEDRLKKITEFSLNNPDMMKLWLGPQLVVFVNSPDRIKKVLVSPKCVEKWNLIYKLIDRNHGLIAASSRVNWRNHRKFFNVSFSATSVEKFLPAFSHLSDAFCSDLEREDGQQEFDFFGYAKRFSFDVIAKTLIGVDVASSENKNISFDQILDAFEM